MTRITETTNVTLTRTAVAPRIVINWNPIDDSGSVDFQVQHIEEVDGAFQRMTPAPSIAFPIEDIMSRAVNIPLPDGSTFAFPPLLIGAYIKQVFDDIYTEYAAAQAAAPTDDAE